MAEETKKVEETTEQVSEKTNATVEKNDVDYDAELLKVQEETKEKNKFGASRRLASKEVKEEMDEDEKTDELADKILARILPAVKSTTESGIFETKLDKLSGGNESKKKLIKYHYENSTNPSQDIDSRLTVALAASNQKNIAKQEQEINIAQNNRSQISNNSQGTSMPTVEHTVEGTFSKEQLAQLQDYANRYDLIYAGFPERAKRAKERYLKLARQRLGA